MATRFYFPVIVSTPALPDADPNWEQNSGSTRMSLVNKKAQPILQALSDSPAFVIPITTTQDILGYQLVSDPLPAQRIEGTISLVIRVFENAISNNATLAVSLRVMDTEAQVVRGTLFSAFGTDTEFPVVASAATRRVNAQALTPVSAVAGDRLVLELGARATAPTAAGSFTMRVGNSGASDFALTSGLTTDLNPWMELSQDVFTPYRLNNFQRVKVDPYSSVSDKGNTSVSL